MINYAGIPQTRIYIFGALVFLITAWFSVGFNHFDEHFQVLEFAGLKLGLTEQANLPWEYSCMMRPAFQPTIVYAIYKTVSFTGISDPFIIAFIIRLLSAALTFLSIHLIIMSYAPGIKNQKLIYGFLLLSFFLWFIPYNGARFSSDTTSGVIFLIGLAWFLLHQKLKTFNYFITGIFLGISFITRYQVAFLIIGFAAWLLIIHKSGFLKFLLFSMGILLMVILGVIIDRWFYGEFTVTFVNYFRQNIILGKASAFGTFPWWYYFQQVFMNAIPPFSLVYIFAVLIYVFYYPKDLLTWTIVPFLVVHFLIPHKEIRFLFPIIGLLPIMIIRSADVILEKNGDGILQKRVVKLIEKLFWLTNFVMLVILAFRPADDQIPLYKKIWDNYSSPAKLYFSGTNPYHRASVDINFYKKKNLVFKQVDSFATIVPSPDTISLVATENPAPLFDKQFRPVLIYSSFPKWVRRFNFNHWIERTNFWYVYELKTSNIDPGLGR